MTIALLDADIIAFRAASVLQEDPWDPSADKQPLSETQAVHTALLIAANWIEESGCDSGICCLTGKLNFRKLILPSYKSNRGPKPDTLGACRAALMELPHRLVEGLEADDLLGILLTNGRYPDAICVSVDKDLLSVPGRHYNPVRKVHTVVSEQEATRAWLLQALMGDATDGYTGIPGVGPAKAAKILPTVGHGWNEVLSAYQKAGLSFDDALVQARVARILRHEDYDRSTKEISLWHPTNPHRLPLSSLSPVQPPSPSPSCDMVSSSGESLA